MLTRPISRRTEMFQAIAGHAARCTAGSLPGGKSGSGRPVEFHVLMPLS